MKSLVLRHIQVCIACLGAMIRQPLSSVLTLGGIGVALAIPLVLYVLVFNLTSVFEGWGVEPQLSLYLELDVATGYAEELAVQLKEDPAIANVVVINKAQGLAELLKQGSLAGLRNQLEDNPLPDVIEIHPQPNIEKSDYSDFRQRLMGLDRVADVQLDLEWVERLRAVTDLAMVVIQVFWGLLFAGIALVISNSVRMSLVTARDEVEVISLVGGSESFIRRPYLYTGFLQGALGGVFAIVISGVVFGLFFPALERLLDAYLGISTVRFAPIGLLLRIVGMAALLGWIASLLTVERYLRDVLPR